MSVFTNIEKVADNLWNELIESKAAQIIDNVYNAVVAELESIGPAAVEQIAETMGVAALDALPAGAEAAIAAGVAAAPAALKAAEKEISAQTINVLASSVVTQLQAQAATTSASGLAK